MKKEELTKKEKPLGINGRNNGTRTYKIVKRPPKKANGPKGAPRKEVVSPWES